MNFYDKIHALVKELKDTPEYVNYMAIKEYTLKYRSKK